MLPMLRQHSVRLAVALLSVLVLTRLPSVGFAEEPTSLSANIQENVVLAADVVSTAFGICVATLDGVVAREAYVDGSDSNPAFIQPSILRL